jgi:deoxycytidylate deaminase
MPLKDVLVIGLTGSFGSGCSTFRQVLEAGKFERKDKVLKFKGFSLSQFVKARWLEQNWSKFNPTKPLQSATKKEREATLRKAKRSELQDVGNEIRKHRHSYDRLAQLATEEAYRESSNIKDVSLVFDSVRNTAEIKTLKERFPNFYLIAVDCDRGQRWNRVREIYERNGQSETDFNKDDERDRGEDIAYGQQVELCVDVADMMVKNDEPYSESVSRLAKLQEKIEPYITLLSGGEPRTPEPDEFLMSLAYTASLNSKCFKRQVGAIVADKGNNVLSVGYNENRLPHQPCVDNPGDCQRDIYKREYFEKLRKDKTAICPNTDCMKPLEYTADFKCEKCGYKLDTYFIPDKALSRCTALHAEARALRSLKRNELHEGSVLYTTASPCLMCAVEIVNAGVKEVVYSEAYTDTKALEFLKKEDVATRKFQGVKANAYFKMFSTWRMETEKEIKGRVDRFRT